MAISSPKQMGAAFAEFIKHMQTQIDLRPPMDDIDLGRKLPPMYDNFPVNGTTNYGQNGYPTYYYLGEPTKEELAAVARKTPFGWKLTHLFAKDCFNNDFLLEFPYNKDFTKETIDEINGLIRQELMKVNFYREARKWHGYDKEQGRSLLMIYREGDGAELISSNKISDPKYDGMRAPANLSKDVIRVQAINYTDYNIPFLGTLGEPEMFNINFWGQMNSMRGFYVHPSRAIEMKTDEIDLDQYKGQPSTKACYAQLNVLTSIFADISDALYRWGHGWAWFRFKGLRTTDDFTKATTKVGNPNSRTFFVSGPEVEDIKMLGAQQTQMNLYEIFDMLVDSICVAAGIPKVIMMGQQGVNRAGEVMQREYFATLDKEHTNINPFIEKFFAICPQIQRIFKKYNITQYRINWGLRQVMSDEEKATLQQQQASIANAEAMFVSWEEVRARLGKPSWVEYFANKEGGEALCKSIYGISPKMLDATSPRAGEFRQRFLQEVLQSPEEQKAAKEQQMLGEQGNVENMNRSQGSSSPTNGTPKNSAAAYEKELNRREAKALRGGDQQDHDSIIAKLENEIKLLNATLQAERTTAEDRAKDLVDMLQKARSTKEMDEFAISMNSLAEECGVNKSTITRLYDKLQLILANAKPKAK